MPRPILDEARIHPAIRERIAAHYAEVVGEVQQAIGAHPVVVVGMRAIRSRARRAAPWTLPACLTTISSTAAI